jgi:Secretion system C-terminal sorting domain
LLWGGGKLTLSVFLTLFYLHTSIAQADVYPRVENIRYKTSVTERIKVNKEVNLKTLTFNDKLLFIEKKIVHNHSEYLNDNLNPVHEITYISSNNMYPKWYVPAEKIKIDETGVTSFIKNNELLKNGWVGANVDFINPLNKYYKDGETKYTKEEHTPFGLEFYNAGKEIINEMGYLANFKFTYPDNAILEVLAANNFQVNSNTSYITISNEKLKNRWDLVNKTIKIEFLNNSLIEKTLVTKYVYNDFFQQYLKSTVTESIPGYFENGDCLEHLKITNYSEYGQNSNNYELRKSNPNAIIDLKIIPNPANDFITISIPSHDIPTKITISTITGRLVKEINISPNVMYQKIDINDFEQGVFLVSMVLNNQLITSKFVKL